MFLIKTQKLSVITSININKTFRFEFLILYSSKYYFMHEQKYNIHKFYIQRVLICFAILISFMITAFEIMDVIYIKIAVTLFWSLWFYVIFRYKGIQMNVSIKNYHTISINNHVFLLDDIKKIIIWRGMYRFCLIKLKDGKRFFIDSYKYGYGLRNFTDDMIALIESQHSQIDIKQYFLKSNKRNKWIFYIVFIPLFILIMYIDFTQTFKTYFSHLYLPFICTIPIFFIGIFVPDKNIPK